MARGKHDEAFDRETEKMTRLGLENADHIRKARYWCKHFRIEMVSAGLLAQMTGLPIGSHRISCQYASETSEAMNLPWIIPEFLIKNCKGCRYHESNGDITWGKEIIEKFERQELERAENDRIRKYQLAALRKQLRTLSQQATRSTKPTERQILFFIEKIFSEEEDERKESSEQLIQAAKIGSDLFPPIAIDLLTKQSLSIQFASQCSPVCVELSKRRPDLARTFLNVAFESIRKRIFPESAANILVNIENELVFPLPSEIIENLIASQSHSHFMGSMYRGSREYPYSNQLLGKSYDTNANSVTEPLKNLLNVDEKYRRINVCGVIEELQEKRPQLGLDLLPNLVSAFELPDDPYEESADGRIRQCIAKIYRFAPIHVDEYLASQIPVRRSAVQQEIVAIYSKVISVPYREAEKEEDNEEVLTVELAISRCISLIKENSLDVEVRLEAARAIKEACTDRPKAMAEYFNNLLGYYLLICEKDTPSLPPKIILPNQAKPDTYLEQLDKYNYKQQWGMFISEIFDGVKALASRTPQVIGLDVIKYYDSLDSKTNLTSKSSIVDLLGEVGQSYSFQPQVLPYIMKSLMDFDSQAIRAHGIRAVEKIYADSTGEPPKNIVDVLVLHLRDSFVIVHKAAIKALSRKFRWLSYEQTIEALSIISGWMETYKNKPYDLEDLCNAALRMSSPYDAIKRNITLLVCYYFPTNEHIADQRILEQLINFVKPDEPIAEIIAKKLVWFLKKYPRDRYHDYGYSTRSHFLRWLHQLPQNKYVKIKDDIKDAALELAKNDAWESCLFASLFVHQNDFDIEREIIEAAANSLGGEMQYEKFEHELRAIQLIAESNAEKIRGNLFRANELASQIIEANT
jgi:hypothetical protein